jgi:hypothetical protein
MDGPILRRVFQCKNQKCGTLLRLPLDRLSQLSMHPATPSICASAVALLCHRCKQIRTYSLEASSSDHVGEDRRVSLAQTEGLDRLVWLTCEEETCEIHLPLLETWNQITTPERIAKQHEANAEALKKGWTDLLCPKGHPVLFPQTR